jgi:hypothetical protein
MIWALLFVVMLLTLAGHPRIAMFVLILSCALRLSYWFSEEMPYGK